MGWQRHYFNSYQVVTLIGMYFIPVYFSVELHFYKMLVIWATFSVATAYVVFKATRKPLAQTTPRSVYTYFTVLYKLTYFATFGGYVNPSVGGHMFSAMTGQRQVAYSVASRITSRRCCCFCVESPSSAPPC